MFTQFPEEFSVLPHFRTPVLLHFRTSALRDVRAGHNVPECDLPPAPFKMALLIASLPRVGSTCWVTAFAACGELDFPLSISCSTCFPEFGSSPDGGKFPTRAP